MKKITKYNVLLFGLFLAFLPYFYLSVFSNPSSDDFSLSAQAMENNFFELLYRSYLNWNGRYISNIFIYLNPISFGSFKFYKIIPAGMIILFVFGNYIFIRQLFYQKNKQTHLIMSLILSLLYINNMPIISEGVYWFTGTVIYLLGIIVFLFYVSLLIKIIRKKKKGASLILLNLLLFISCGFNEVLTLLVIFFLAVITFIFYRENFRSKKVVIMQLVFSMLFSSILIFAPGNELRGGVYQDAHNFSSSVLYSILQIGRFSLAWTVSLPFVVASVIFYKLNEKLRIESKLFEKGFYLKKWESLLLLFATIFICVFPPYWATGILGQHRTLNVAYFFFLVTWFINLTVWFNFYQNKIKFVFKKEAVSFLFLFLLVGIFFTGNEYAAITDIYSGNAKRYNQELTERFKFLKEQKNKRQTRMEIQALSVKPTSIFVSDITDNPNDWKNKAYNLYFRLDSTEVVIK
jgi:Family of unknown function (DUF6056)